MDATRVFENRCFLYVRAGEPACSFEHSHDVPSPWQHDSIAFPEQEFTFVRYLWAFGAISNAIVWSGGHEGTAATNDTDNTTTQTCSPSNIPIYQPTLDAISPLSILTFNSRLSSLAHPVCCRSPSRLMQRTRLIPRCRIRLSDTIAKARRTSSTQPSA